MGELVETQAAAAGVTFHRERAGGTISFTSEEGVGTTFTIEFRFLLAPETEKGDNSKDNTMQDFQGTQQIRAMHRPDAATIPIIAMTANAFADDIQQSKEAGKEKPGKGGSDCCVGQCLSENSVALRLEYCYGYFTYS